nr:hypothetical protein [Tanacetum cinerariifolium]
QTQTSNTLHNAIMEAGSKDRPPMLEPGNYNPPYKFTWADTEIPISKGSPVIRTESQIETYKTVSQDIRDQLNVEAEAVQIILTGIDNDIYSIVDACSNACEMWKAIERFVTLVKQSQELKTVSNHNLYDNLKQHQNEVNELRAERIARVANLLALVAQQQPVYNPQINKSTGYENQRIGNVARARETVEQPDWRDDSDDDELEDQELKAHYMYMAQLQEVSLDAADSGPIFDAEPLQKPSNDDHYNVFAFESAHPEQSKPVPDTRRD